jgi:hypothetical protein
MAKRPACRAVVLSRHVEEGRRCRVQSPRHRRRARRGNAEDQQRPEDQASGGARDWNGVRRGATKTIAMRSTCSISRRSKKRRQLRRLRHERVRGEINCGADRAIIVAVVAGLLGRKRLRLRAANRRPWSRDACDGRRSRWTCPNDRTSCSASAASARQPPNDLLRRTQPIGRTPTLTPGRSYICQSTIEPISHNAIASNLTFHHGD